MDKHDHKHNKHKHEHKHEHGHEAECKETLGPAAWVRSPLPGSAYIAFAAGLKKKKKSTAKRTARTTTSTDRTPCAGQRPRSRQYGRCLRLCLGFFQAAPSESRAVCSMAVRLMFRPRAFEVRHMGGKFAQGGR